MTKCVNHNAEKYVTVVFGDIGAPDLVRPLIASPPADQGKLGTRDDALATLVEAIDKFVANGEQARSAECGVIRTGSGVSELAQRARQEDCVDRGKW